MRVMCAPVLGFETIVLLLTTPVLLTVADIATATALVAGLGLGVLALVAAATLRYRVGYLLGHLVQVGALALGFAIPVMFVLGGVFAVLWVTAVVLGRRIERVHAERDAAA